MDGEMGLSGIINLVLGRKGRIGINFVFFCFFGRSCPVVGMREGNGMEMYY